MFIHLTLYFKASIFKVTVGLSLLRAAGSLTCPNGRGEVIEMSIVWIGLVIFLSVGMFLTLALCRCAAMADRGIDIYLVHEDQQATAPPEHEGTALQVQ